MANSEKIFSSSVKFSPKVDLIAGHIVALFHALFLSSCLGSIATEVLKLYWSP